MPRETYFGVGGSWQKCTEFFIGTHPYISISYTGTSALLEFSGSSTATTAHQSILLKTSTAGMPTNSDVLNFGAAYNTDSTYRTYSLSTGSITTGQTLYVKAGFCSGSNGIGNADIYTSQLYNSGANPTNKGDLIWRPIYELHAWDGSTWRRTDTEAGAPTIVSVYKSVIDPFTFDVYYTLSHTSPYGYFLETSYMGLSVGPYDVSGTSGGSFRVFSDSSLTYEAVMTDGVTPYGTVHYI